MKTINTNIPTPNQYLADLQKEETEQGLEIIQAIAEEHDALLNTWLTGVNNQVKSILYNREIKNYDSFIKKLTLALDEGLAWANEVDALPEDVYHNFMVKEWLEASFAVATVETVKLGFDCYKSYIAEAKLEIQQQFKKIEDKNSEIKKLNDKHEKTVETNAQKLLEIHAVEIASKNSEIGKMWHTHNEESRNDKSMIGQLESHAKNLNNDLRIAHEKLTFNFSTNAVILIIFYTIMLLFSSIVALHVVADLDKLLALSLGILLTVFAVIFSLHMYDENSDAVLFWLIPIITTIGGYMTPLLFNFSKYINNAALDQIRLIGYISIFLIATLLTINLKINQQ